MKTYMQVRIIMISLYMGQTVESIQIRGGYREKGHFGHKNNNGFYHKVGR
jgi:hypothetical protein